jgi:hypothetical protein
MMQNKTLSVDSASKLVVSMWKFLLTYQGNRFKDMLRKAKELLKEMCMA